MKRKRAPKIKEDPLLPLIEAMESDESDLAPPEALIYPVNVQEDLISLNVTLNSSGGIPRRKITMPMKISLKLNYR